jgi:glycosyltransferase involved in cell wall biosynthesis
MAEASPTLSVVVPAYNAEALLGTCIDSILEQTFPDFELIVVDDGSTDATLSLLRSYAAQDDRVQILAQSNSFAGVARNHGMKHAKGEFLLFLDADDSFAPTMFEKLVERAKDTEADVVVCACQVLDGESGEITDPYFGLDVEDPAAVLSADEMAETLYQFTFLWPWNKLFKAEFIAEHGLQFQALRSANDVYFVAMALALSTRIAFIPEALVTYRQILSSLTHTKEASWHNVIEALLSVQDRLGDLGLYDRFEHTFTVKALSELPWYLCTLSHDTRLSVRDSIRDEVLPRLRMDDAVAQHNPAGYRIGKLTEIDESDLLLSAVVREQEFDSAEQYARRLEGIVRDYERVILERDDTQASLYETITLQASKVDELHEKLSIMTEHARTLEGCLADRDAAIASLKQSVSFRVGSALTLVPRLIKAKVTQRRQ